MEVRAELRRSSRAGSFVSGWFFHNAENLSGGLGAESRLNIVDSNRDFEREE
jgi:hypothetical protein